ncbi:MAG: hypothetical protein IH968_08445 [Gemmatimonadetes bacterium]|nr:hypothetical protein [Gemmatimonadota bacterium]
MGACICVVDLKAIRHAGKFIGEDWLYVIGLNGRRGTIRGNGKDRIYAAGQRPRWTLVTPTTGKPLTLDITIHTVEQDLLFDDENPAVTRLHTKVVQCPGPDSAKPGKLLNQIIQVPVTEDYGLFKGKTNTVSFAFDILAYYHADIDAEADSGAAGNP